MEILNLNYTQEFFFILRLLSLRLKYLAHTERAEKILSAGSALNLHFLPQSKNLWK